MFTTENLIFCYGQAHTVLLPHDFLFFSVFGKKTVGDITISWDSFLSSLTKSLALLVVISVQPSSFSDLLELRTWILDDQVWHSNWNCQRTTPKHLTGPHRRSSDLLDNKTLVLLLFFAVLCQRRSDNVQVSYILALWRGWPASGGNWHTTLRFTP